MTVKEMAKKVRGWIITLFILGVIVEAIYASTNGKEAWIMQTIYALETYFGF